MRCWRDARPKIMVRRVRCRSCFGTFPFTSDSTGRSVARYTQVACSGPRRRGRTGRWVCGVVEPALAAFAAQEPERRAQGLERNARLEPGRKPRLGMCTGPLVGLDGEGAPKGSVRAAPAASQAVQASRIVTTALCCRHRARELRSVAGWGYTQLRLRHNTCSRHACLCSGVAIVVYRRLDIPTVSAGDHADHLWLSHGPLIMWATR
jgi:hypothetical protein